MTPTDHPELFDALDKALEEAAKVGLPTYGIEQLIALAKADNGQGVGSTTSQQPAG